MNKTFTLTLTEAEIGVVMNALGIHASQLRDAAMKYPQSKADLLSCSDKVEAIRNKAFAAFAKKGVA